jgi:serine/threonine protein kinase
MDPLGINGMCLAGYTVLAYVDKGAFGFVYEAQEASSGARVALKILHPQAGWIQHQEFSNEATLLLKLTGASRVVSYLGSERASVPVPNLAVTFPLDFHVFELADGSLSDLLTSLHSLSWLTRLSLFRDVALGVHQMHLKRIVHRDLKASNCLLFDDGKGLTTKVADLGRSRSLAQPALQPALVYQVMRGDPSYAPPELLWGTGEDDPQVHKCADLYGLGSLLIELSTGQSLTTLAAPTVLPTFPLADVDTMRRVYAANVPAIRAGFESSYELFESDIPASIRPHAGALVRKLCDPDPERRLPQVSLGRRAARDDGIQWLVNRTDIVRLTLRKAHEQQALLQQKKGAVA